MTTRRFSIADAMILVVAAAVASMIFRYYLPGFSAQLGYLPSFRVDRHGLWRAFIYVNGPGTCLVVPWMAATIVIRLRRPRPRLVRFQPGFAACLAVMVSILPGLAWFSTIHHRPGFHSPQGFEQAWAISLDWSSTAVPGAWLALLMLGKWRAEPSWIDRMGRALGWYWVALLVALHAIQWLEASQRFLARWGSS